MREGPAYHRAQREGGEHPEKHLRPAEPAKKAGQDACKFHVSQTESGGREESQDEIPGNRESGSRRRATQSRQVAVQDRRGRECCEQGEVERTDDGIGQALHREVDDHQQGTAHGEDGESGELGPAVSQECGSRSGAGRHEGVQPGAQPKDSTPARRCIHGVSATAAVPVASAVGRARMATRQLNALAMSMRRRAEQDDEQHGRMHSIKGKMTLTGICIAFSSARCLRLIRICWPGCAARRRSRPVGVGLDHGTGESAQVGDIGPARRALVGLPSAAPISMSCSVRTSSSASGPLPLRPAWAMADSKPSPASTAMVIWSRVSARSSAIASRPLLALAVQQEFRHEVGDHSHDRTEEAYARSTG